ncbi:MAG TPA: acireductone synthase, partial [Pyrinomonadaceae bacterium]|nr:acireductone synthase [Pyrinomonadaceae bacterium]
MKAILLDIEGTTTPIDFVHKRLFPYAKTKIGEYVETHFDEIQTEIEQLKTEYRKDFTDQIYGRDFRADAPESVANYLKFLIEVDRKSTPLKSLQGKIWQAGYESGELRSEMFEDVPHAFERWKAQGKTIAIFSSGSVLAQKLIFKYSNSGDLSGFISEYFDTNIGSKKEAESYVKIAAALNHPPKRIAFVSDILAELDAARNAGFQTTLAVRK